MEYTEGPICGVDNCPSHLWKRIDGRSVCQFGHINEYDVEIIDDDNYVENDSRRVVRSISKIAGVTDKDQQARQDFIDAQLTYQSLTTKQRRMYRERAIQIILAKQCKYVIKKFQIVGTNKEMFLKVIKAFWMHELQQEHLNFNNVTMKLYLALIKIGIPVYLCDFISMLEDHYFPFINTYAFIPKELAKLVRNKGKLNTNFIQHLNKVLFWKTDRLPILMDNRMVLNYYPLIVRLTLHLRLPLEIIVLSHQLIQQCKLKFKFYTKMYNHPELALSGIVIGMAKLYFTVNPKIYPRWVYNYYKSLNSHIGSDFEIQRLNSRLISRHYSELKDLRKWDDQKIAQFIKYYRSTFMQRHKVLDELFKSDIAQMNKIQELKIFDKVFNYQYELPDKDHKNKQYMDHLKDTYNDIYIPIQDDEDIQLDILENDPILMDIYGRLITTMYNCNTLDLIKDLKWANNQINNYISGIDRLKKSIMKNHGLISSGEITHDLLGRSLVEESDSDNDAESIINKYREKLFLQRKQKHLHQHLELDPIIKPKLKLKVNNKESHDVKPKRKSKRKNNGKSKKALVEPQNFVSNKNSSNKKKSSSENTEEDQPDSSEDSSDEIVNNIDNSQVNIFESLVSKNGNRSSALDHNSSSGESGSDLDSDSEIKKGSSQVTASIYKHQSNARNKSNNQPQVKREDGKGETSRTNELGNNGATTGHSWKTKVSNDSTFQKKAKKNNKRLTDTVPNSHRVYVPRESKLPAETPERASPRIALIKSRIQQSHSREAEQNKSNIEENVPLKLKSLKLSRKTLLKPKHEPTNT